MNEMTLVREFRDSAPASAPAGIRHRVLAQTRAGSRGSGSRGRRTAWAGGGLVAAATATAFVASSLGPSAPPSAAAVLDEAADQVRAAAPTAAPEPDQWIYGRALGWDPVTGRTGGTWEYWQRVDGRRFAQRLPSGRVHVQQVESNPLGTPLDWYRLAAALPTAPAAVLDALEQDPLYTSSASTRADRDFDEVTTALTSGAALPAASVAALYGALATIPGVGVDRDAPADLAGRDVLSITYAGGSALGRPGDRWELLLDPETYRVTGLRGTAGEDIRFKDGSAVAEGEVWFEQTYLSEQVVDRPGDGVV
jgi:hypothetical protein